MSSATETERSASAAPGLRVGLVISDRYQLGAEIGSGGMGLVYEAKHLVLGTTVAIKVLRPELLQESDRAARFLEEARCLAALSSDHVVRIHDAGRLETGLPFLAMDLLSGMNLGELVKACGQLAPPIAVDYAIQACAGLAEAHAIGLVHLDIKPANLFLAAQRNGPAQIKILDFGIARWLGRPLEASPPSVSDSPVGSAFYSSPEQFDGPMDLDLRSDIWSLGVVLFEMLTGQCPFARPRSSESGAEFLVSIPSVRHLRPAIDRRLAAVVETCLERDRNCRFSSMGELASALVPFSSRPSAPSLLSSPSPDLRSRPARSADSTRPPPRPSMCS